MINPPLASNLEEKMSIQKKVACKKVKIDKLLSKTYSQNVVMTKGQQNIQEDMTDSTKIQARKENVSSKLNHHQLNPCI